MTTRAFLVLFSLCPAILLSQQTGSIPGAARLEIRSADSLRVVDVRVDVGRGLFESIGVMRPAAGTVDCRGRGCVATTPAILNLTPYNGAGTLTASDSSSEIHVTVISLESPEHRLVATGPVVSFERTDRGALRIRAARVHDATR
jgi:hypothetical protein